MTIFTSSDFTGYTVDTPNGQSGNPIDTGSITLIKSDATTETVFDTLTTAFKMFKLYEFEKYVLLNGW